MDGDPTRFTRLIWFAVAVLVVVAAAWFGVAIAQHSLQTDTPDEVAPENPGAD